MLKFAAEMRLRLNSKIPSTSQQKCCPVILTTEQKRTRALIVHRCILLNKGYLHSNKTSKRNLTFNEPFLLQRLQRRPLQDQFLQPGLHPLPLRVLQVGRRARDCRGRKGGGGGREGGREGGGGQRGAGEKVSWDGGEDEKREGRATALVRRDRRGDYLPRWPRENISGLDGGEDGGQDGGM